MNKNKNTKPFLEMPVTYCIGSDKYAGKITNMQGTKFLTVLCDQLQNYPKVFSLRNNGLYMIVGAQCGHLILGTAINDLDPNF